eukprot:scaffold3362_cov402-Prasinococcus_capsulatus_cf.AAC.20
MYLYGHPSTTEALHRSRPLRWPAALGPMLPEGHLSRGHLADPRRPSTRDDHIFAAQRPGTRVRDLGLFRVLLILHSRWACRSAQRVAERGSARRLPSFVGPFHPSVKPSIKGLLDSERRLQGPPPSAARRAAASTARATQSGRQFIGRSGVPAAAADGQRCIGSRSPSRASLAASGGAKNGRKAWWRRP